MSQQPGQNVKPPRTTAIQVPQDVGRKTRKTKVQNCNLMLINSASGAYSYTYHDQMSEA